MKRASLLVLCAVVSAGLLSGPADARSRGQDREQRSEQRQEQRQDRPERREPQRDNRGDRGDRSGDAARQAQQRNGGGRVLSVDPENGGYRVKVLKDGEVRTHHVDVDR
jgi:hypothetical protein